MKRKEEPPPHCVSVAVAQANKSPCSKSQRGVVVFDPILSEVLSMGTNFQPGNHICDGSKECQKTCNKLCVHAEQAALLDLRTDNTNLSMLHVKTKNGELVHSGEPSCWQCSRLVLADNRISWFWLYHEDGWHKYTTKLFHELTLNKCNLPIIQG
jgi:deoxycytidylate deaminase